MIIQRLMGGESSSLPLGEWGNKQDGCRGRIVGASPRMTELRAIMAKVACVDSPVLIHGEVGTGKRVVAEALHYSGARSGGPLVIHACHTWGGEAAECEELETHFPCAAGGTLVLEEVGALSLRAQVCLLTRLQEQRERGSFRLVATTTFPLEQAVAAGEFRRDLYFALHVVPLEVPPLRQRLADLPLLVAEWSERFCQRNGTRVPPVGAGVLEQLRRYSWPGNLQELEGALERAVVLSGGARPLEAADFAFLEESASTEPVSLTSSAALDEPLMTLDELERRHVLRTLEHTRQNRTRAANLLNISVRTLRNKLHQYRNAGLIGE